MCFIYNKKLIFNADLIFLFEILMFLLLYLCLEKNNLIKHLNKQMILQENISLLPYNTFGIDVFCRYFIEYDSVAELQEIIKSDVFKNNQVLHIGSGSNLLFMNDFEGLILHSKIKGIKLVKETTNDVYLRVGAGEIWDNFVGYAVNANYCGVENLSCIPGEAGSSVVQNIGAYGVEVKDVFSSAEAVEIKTGNIKIFSKEECQFNYRDSVFKNDKKSKYIITNVEYQLSKKTQYRLDYGNIAEMLKLETKVNLSTIRSVVTKIRNEKLPDPKKIANAGSFFMNPIVPVEQYMELKQEYTEIPGFKISPFQVKIPAAWLIEQCGWKGKTSGRVGVYENQALVLVNYGNATGQEIMRFAGKIINSVKEKFNIELFPEVNIIE
jgi:UDP-N-acetylmuramate dehydrogenase